MGSRYVLPVLAPRMFAGTWLAARCEWLLSPLLNLFLQIFFALSPLLVLGYILFSAFESEEAENKKRNKKTDFNLEGHAE